jgi:hypothetical protein
VARNRKVASAILELTEDLKAVTIDAILAKGDLELGLEHLAGLFPPARRRGPRSR